MSSNHWRKAGQACLTYCKEQNGLSSCKNCGLSKEILDGIEAEVREEVIEEVEMAIGEIPSTLKYENGDYLLGFNDAINKILIHLRLKEKETKE